jgi:hypothetical protein
MKRHLAGVLAVLVVAGLTGPAAANAAPAVQTAHGRTVFVAVGGHDSGPGTRTHPLATIQTAITRAGRGGVVQLRGGHYHQRVTIHDATGLTVRAYGHEHAVLDGSGLRPPAGRSAMVDISDSDRVTIAGLDITGYRTTAIAAMPIGVYVHGGDSRISIVGDHVHDLGNHNPTLGSMDMNAHGIAAYGDDPKRPISALTIAGNEVDHLTLGASESVVVNGNVDGWQIVGNRIHDNNNIGIDAIGYEPTLTGTYRYTDTNRARNGYIGENEVDRIRSQGNPAYWSPSGWCNCADGIYVDGGTHIVIERNRSGANDIGIEVAAENARGAADHVIVRSNVVHDSRFVGITTGGYCDGGSDCGDVHTGRSFDNAIVNNTLYGNNTDNDGSPELLIQYYATGNRIENNLIVATDKAHAVVGTVPRSTSGHNIVDHNVYDATGATSATATWGTAGTTYTGFAAYRAATRLDPHSLFADPRLVNPARRNLAPGPGSPAFRVGVLLPVSIVGRVDVAGRPRITNGHITVGAYQ